MSKKDIRKKHQGYVNSIVSKLTKLFVFLFLFCALPAAAQPALEAKQLSSESCSREFYNLACDIIYSKNINQVEAEKAITLLRAARDLDKKADFVAHDLIQLSWQYPERDRSDVIYELLTEHLKKKTERQTLKMAASYLLDKANNRNQRELLINGLLRISKAKNNYLSSELFTSLGFLRSELSDPNVSTYFISAYNYNPYNKLAFAKLLESAPEKLNLLSYLENLRITLRENPLNIDSAVNLAEYARQLQLYQVATDAYEYCSQLYRYLYPSQKLPSYIYLPWSISAYNTKTSRYKCLQIADEVEKESGFNLILRAIAAKALLKTTDFEQAEKIFKDAEINAKANYLNETSGQSQTPKIETCSSLAWFYCFAREDAKQALLWATKAHAIEPNSPTTNGLLAYSLVMNKQTEQAEEIAQKFQLNQVANLALAQALILQDQKEQAIQTLKEAIEKDAGSFEAEIAKQKLSELGEEYTPQLNTEAIETALARNVDRPFVPKFIPPDKIISIEANLRGTQFPYNKDFGALLTIKNNSKEPLIISDDGLFSGNIRVDAKIRGDINKDIPDLLSFKYQPTEPIESGKSLQIPLNLNIGELRRILTDHPQATLGILFTFYLDPVITENKKVANRLADIEPIEYRATRTAEKISSSYLRYRINSLSGGSQGQKVSTAKLFAALLAEQQDMFKGRTSYQFLYADWMPAALKSALHKCLKDYNWNVKIQTMAAMAGLTLDSRLTNDVAENLNDSAWPVRLMALYQLEKNGYNFGKILDRMARYDLNPRVREMAIALGGTAPETQREPKPVLPPDLTEPNQTDTNIAF